MTPEPELQAIFFPPRIVRMNMQAGDSHEVLNDVNRRYCDEGIVVLMNDDMMRDALKIIQYAAAYPSVCDPTWEQGPTKIEVEQEPDMVNHPPHYTGGGIETIEYLRAKLTPDEFRGFCKGNALKYLSRAGKKGDEAEDCAKAQWYLDQLTKTPPAKS